MYLEKRKDKKRKSQLGYVAEPARLQIDVENEIHNLLEIKNLRVVDKP